MSAQLQRRPPQSAPPRSRFGRDVPWDNTFYKAPLAIIGLRERGCFRGETQRDLVNLLIERMYLGGGMPAEDEFGDWIRTPREEDLEKLHCSPRELSYSLDDLVESRIGESKKTGREVYYRIRPDWWSTVAPWIERRKARAAIDRAPRPAKTRAIVEPEPPPTVELAPQETQPVPLPAPVEHVAVKNTSSFYISFTPFFVGGELLLEVNAMPEKPNTCSTVQVFSPQLDDSKQNRENNVRDVVQPLAEDLWGHPVDTALIERLTRTLGETPIENFRKVLFPKGKPPRLRRSDAPGLLVKLAEQAKSMHAEAVLRESRAQTAEPPTPEEDTPEEAERLWEENRAKNRRLTEERRNKEGGSIQ